jgi:hypothetical protein
MSLMGFFNVLTDPWLYAALAFTVVVYFLAHRDGFEVGVITGVNKAIDEMVREGLIYIDERDEMKRRKK